MEDSYYTIKREGKGYINEKMSRFLSFSHPVRTREEIQEIIKRYVNEYHDARHVCWAWMLGPARKESMLSDNGEPSGTAGKPILGQINSKGLTDVLVIVVRYFGGIKLGTSGLISAYRAAAAEALEDSGVEEKFRSVLLRVTFPYQSADGVMKLIKGEGLETLESSFDNTCSLLVSVRKSRMEELSGRFQKVSGVTVQEEMSDEL